MLPDTQATEITPLALQPLLADDSDTRIRLIDCREEDEFALCRIEGAELVPLSRFAELVPGLLSEETKPIVVYCHHGMRSLNATLFLRQRGIDQVWSLAGGIDLWSTQVDPAVPRY